MTRGKLLKVTWIDASDPANKQSWFDEDDVKKFVDQDVTFVSVGWEYSRTSKYLTLIADYQLEGEPDSKFVVGRLTKIPSAWIRDEFDIKEG